MRGGIPEPDPALSLQHRDALRARIAHLGEGALFALEDIAHTEDEQADLTAMRNHDHFHVIDGLFTGVVETVYLRRPPRLAALLDSYARHRGCTLVETGDWAAWRTGLKGWEPIEGHRYHSDGPAETLSYGTRMKIRILNSPDWLRASDEGGALFRMFHDLSEKDRRAVFRRMESVPSLAGLDLDAALEHAETIPDVDLHQGDPSPADTRDLIADVAHARKARLDRPT